VEEDMAMSCLGYYYLDNGCLVQKVRLERLLDKQHQYFSRRSSELLLLQKAYDLKKKQA